MKFIEDVVSGKLLIGSYARLAIVRHLNDLKNKAERASQMAVINKMSSEAMLMAKQYPRKFWEL